LSLQWVESREHTAKYDLSSSCAAPISIDDLIGLSDNSKRTEEALSTRSLKLSYGPMRGSDALRENLANLYSARAAGVTQDDILTTNAGIDANHIALTALVSDGDHVICHYPTYEQLYQVPRALGAEVSLWKASKKWQLDIEELKTLIRPNTKLIIINTPNNPTGAIVPKPTLELLMELAEEKGITIMSDEVFRPLFHSITPASEDFPPSAINLGYKNVVVTGSFSKAYSMPGIRTGWIVSRNKQIIEACHSIRHYTTTSVSRLDEAVAAEAVSDRCIHALLARNIQIAKKNIQLIQDFIDEHSWACSWTPPVAGATAFIKFAKMGKPVDDEEFCVRLQDKMGVLLAPGSRCFGGGQDFKGYVRIGLAMETAAVKEGLAALATFLEDDFESIPVAKK